MPDVISEKICKAKKEHICDYCLLEIGVGEQYEDQFLAYDGQAYHWKSHLSCKKLTSALKMFDDCWYDEGITADSFHESVIEYLQRNEISYTGWAAGLARAKERLLEGEVAENG